MRARLLGFLFDVFLFRIRTVGMKLFVKLVAPGGELVTVDRCVAPMVAKLRFWVNKNGYAYYSRGKLGPRSLARFVTDAPPGFEVDHKDHNRLNNRRSNLRVVSRSFNNHNKKDAPNSTGLRGVTRTRYGTFQVMFTNKGKAEYLGCYATPEEASAVYHARRKQVVPELY